MMFDFSLSMLLDRLSEAGLSPQLLNASSVEFQFSITRICTDTRALKPGDLFLTLKGERFNANDYVAQAIDQGAAVAIVDEMRSDFAELSAPVVLVSDALEALAQIALWQRLAFNGPVVSVTGSAGKTSTKQLMASVLSQAFNTCMTQGNLNNHIGVPLTLLSLTPEHQAAVVELGASGLREIADIARLSLPQVGIITNAAAAHLEGFGSLQGVIETKGELIDFVQDGGFIVLNADDAAFPQWKARAEKRQLEIRTFGLQAGADVRARDIQLDLTRSRFIVELRDADGAVETAAVQLPLAGAHNVLNALAVIAAAEGLKLPLQQIVTGLEKASAVAGRMKAMESLRGQTVIDDSYNANPASFLAAIRVLSASPDSWLVMGDMAELGEGAQTAHQEVGEYARTHGVSTLVATGPLSQLAVEAFGEGGYWFDSQKQLTDFINQEAPEQAVILVKGSRS
ncbi:MAG: UDP-N-acetylmuramoyl-tripeptide--D-alanyl-D-alanine ligase, partial [Oceanobacter sp.]